MIDVASLQGWVAEVEAWPIGSHVWGHYAEATDDGPVLCRTENLSACHPGIASLVDGPLRSLAAEAMGEPVAAFKDKVNYKQPGGAGFLPHQDVLAYPGARRVVSILLAIDACTEESGCLWLAPPASGVLPTDDRGVITESLPWTAAPLAAGEAVVIDGLAPHKSDRNRSSSARRVLVASYAPVSEGYDRVTYYAARTSVIAGRADRISTLADFDGQQVVPAAAAVDRCTHG